MRLLATLASEHVVEQVAETGRYKLGWRVLSFATAYQKSNTLIQVSESVLARLAESTRETCCLYVPAANGRLVVLQFESPHELRYTAQIGRVYPFYRGAAGKALLAHMSPSTIARELRACARESGAQSAKRLEVDLEGIRARGFASSSGENIPGVSGIAVPIFARPGTAVASLSVYGPSGRVDTSAIERLREPVVRAGVEISTALGERMALVPDASGDGAETRTSVRTRAR